MKTVSSGLQLVIFKNIFFLETFEVILVRHENHKPCISPGHRLWNYQSNERIKTKCSQFSATRRNENEFCLFRRTVGGSLRCRTNFDKCFCGLYAQIRKEYRKKEALKKLGITATQKFKIVLFALINSSDSTESSPEI